MVTDTLRSKREQLIWIAALLEGEGCFYIAREYGRDKRYPVVQLETTDLDVAERLATYLQARVYPFQPKKPPGRKRRYRVRLGHSRARELMGDLLPFMGERRAKRIREVLDV